MGKDSAADEITISDIGINKVRAPQANEAYTTVRLPSDINPKGDHPVRIKVNSGAGWRVFRQLHPAHLEWTPSWIGTFFDKAHSLQRDPHTSLQINSHSSHLEAWIGQ